VCGTTLRLHSARRNEDDGCQIVEVAVNGARTFHPFVRRALARCAVSEANAEQLHDETTGGGIPRWPSAEAGGSRLIAPALI
jgi:hypothetical protein